MKRERGDFTILFTVYLFTLLPWYIKFQRSCSKLLPLTLVCTIFLVIAISQLQGKLQTQSKTHQKSAKICKMKCTLQFAGLSMGSEKNRQKAKHSERTFSEICRFQLKAETLSVSLPLSVYDNLNLTGTCQYWLISHFWPPPLRLFSILFTTPKFAKTGFYSILSLNVLWSRGSHQKQQHKSKKVECKYR